MTAQPKIHCPACEYQPKPEDRWECIPRCGTSWHTFWTGGHCPGCGHQWSKTQCPTCAVVSAHLAWYHYPEGDPGLEREKDLELERV